MPNTPDSFIHSCKQAAAPSNNGVHSLKLTRVWQRETRGKSRRPEKHVEKGKTDTTKTDTKHVRSGNIFLWRIKKIEFQQGNNFLRKKRQPVMDETQEVIWAYIRCNRYLVLYPRAMQSMPPTCGIETNLSAPFQNTKHTALCNNSVASV